MIAPPFRRHVVLCSTFLGLIVSSSGVRGDTTFSDATAFGVTGTTLHSVTINGAVVPSSSFLKLTPNSLQNATTRTIVHDGAARPVTNQGVWNLVSDGDLETGLQTTLGPSGEYLDVFYVGGPRLTESGVDIVIVDTFMGSLGAYTVTGLDSAGVPIVATTANTVYGPGNLYTTNPTDFDEVNTSVGGPGGTPTYGAHFDVGALTATTIGVDFDTGLLLSGIRITSTAGNALETSEIFGLLNGTPDNVLRLIVDRDSGAMTIKNQTSGPVDISGYSVFSPAGALKRGSWDSIAENSDATVAPSPGDGTVDPDDVWFELGAGTIKTDLSEGTIGTATLAVGQTIELGDVWIKNPNEVDIDFEYLDADGNIANGLIEFTNGDPLIVGDLDYDGDVDLTDWQNEFLPNLITLSLAGVSPAESYEHGDFDGDLDVDLADFQAFVTAYDAANGSGAFARAVPEPNTWALLAGAALVWCVGVRRRGLMLSRCVVRVGTVAMALLTVPLAHAAGVGTVTAVNVDGSFNLAGLTVDGFTFGAGGFIGSKVDLESGVERVVNGTVGIGPATQTIAEASVSDRSLITGYQDHGGVDSHMITFDQVTMTSDISDVVFIRGPNALGPLSFTALDASLTPIAGQTIVTSGAVFNLGTPTVHAFHDITGTDAGSGWATSSVGSFPQPLALAAALDFDPDLALGGILVQSAVGGAGNIEVFEVVRLPQPDKLTLRVNSANGQVSIVNTHVTAIEINGYSITSMESSLNVAGWNSLDEQNYDSDGPGIGQSWQQGGTATAAGVAEAFFSGSSLFTTNDPVPLGNLFSVGDEHDLVFKYSRPDGKVFTGLVDYAAELLGDVNFDGTVDIFDVNVVSDNWGGSGPMGDANGDGTVDIFDVNVISDNWGASAGGAAAVPEPAAFGIAAIAALCIAVPRLRRNWLRIRVASLLILATGVAVAHADVTNDRLYLFGDVMDGSFQDEDAVANAAVGSGAGSGGVTLDGVSEFNDPLFDDDGHNLTPNPAGSLPTYVVVGSGPAARPGAAASSLGVRFDGTNDYLFQADNFTPFNDATPNYSGILTKGMQMWVRPNAAQMGTLQTVVRDGTQFGVRIATTGNWEMIFGGQTTPTSASAYLAANNGWRHVMQRTYGVPFNAGFGGVLYVDGLAVAARAATYSDDTGAGFSVGSRLDGAGEFFRGEVDNLAVFVHGNNGQGPNGGSWGTFELGTDNEFIANILSAYPAGDVNLDGEIQGNGTGLAGTDDVTAFIEAWGYRKLVNGLQVGDLETRMHGDLDFDGAVTLRDWNILRDAYALAGAPPLSAFPVPEPATTWLGLFGSLAAVAYRTWRKKS